jgi:hypothetical protein
VTDFYWVLLDPSDEEMRATERFSSRAEAESWMGSAWSELLAEGAEAVRLVDADGKSYYRMGLREE